MEVFNNQDIVVQIGLFLDIYDIYNLICVNNVTYKGLCDNTYFWKNKYINKYGNKELCNWKKEFNDIYEIWGMGHNRDGKIHSVTGIINEPLNLNRYVRKVASNDITFVTDIDDNFLCLKGWNKKLDIKFKEITREFCNSCLLIDMENNAYVLGTHDYTLIDLNLKVKKIASGWYHHMLIDLKDNVWTFGSNHHGQLGRKGTTNSGLSCLNIKAKQIVCGEYHSMLIDMSDKVWSFGLNDKGQLETGSKDNLPIYLNRKAKFIACGGHHSMFIDMDDNVFSFGCNKYGQLGLGDGENRYIPTPLKMKAKFVACGEYHSFLIDMENNVYGFGYNYYYQLGLGNNGVRNKPTKLNIKARKVSCGDTYTILMV